ncbi:MAG: hypothetical protein N3G19_00705 [Candidatus Pacearchaeota archaeon]|nr:hypothetical protein [Candidatus Pacearchaeota archaeon]
MTVDEITRKLFALLNEMTLAAAQENYKKVQKLNEKYKFLLNNTPYEPDFLKLEMDNCRRSFIIAVSRNFYNSLTFLHDAKTRYNNIKSKVVEKCIWKMGLETGAVKKEDIIKQDLDCLFHFCDGYDINCKKHPEYKRYKYIKDSLLKNWKHGSRKFFKF